MFTEKDDKIRYILAIFLSLLILLVWTFFFSTPIQEAKRSNSTDQETVQQDKNNRQDNEVGPISPTVIKPEKAPAPSQEGKIEEKQIKLQNDNLAVVFSSKNAVIVESKILIDSAVSKNLEISSHQKLQTGRILFSNPEKSSRVLDDYFTVTEQNDQSISFSKNFNFKDQTFTLLKKYTLKEDRIQLEIKFLGLENNHKIKYYLVNGSNLSGFSASKSFFDIKQLSYNIDSDLETALSQGFFDFFSQPVLSLNLKLPVDWIALDDRFFARILKIAPSSKPNQDSLFFFKEKVDPDEIQLEDRTIDSSAWQYHVSGYVMESLEDQFTFYYLPKKRDLLNQFFDLEKEFFFNLFHQYKFMRILSSMMYWVLEEIYQLIGSYGWSILLMTFLLKLSILPLTQKSMKSMQRMQQLSPKIEGIRQNHKNKPQKMNAEIMALYKKEGVNPLGGCLPMLVPLPIFIALYSLFQNMVELQGKSFYWIQDLSLPDVIYQLDQSLPFIGNKLHFLPVVMVITAFVQSMVSPQTNTGSKEARQQMMIMKYFMPFFFFFISWEMPSALILYWTTQNLFSIGQTLIVKKTTVVKEKFKKGAKNVVH